MQHNKALEKFFFNTVILNDDTTQQYQYIVEEKILNIKDMRIRGNTRVSLGYYNLRSLNIIKKVGELSEFFLREKKNVI